MKNLSPQIRFTVPRCLQRQVKARARRRNLTVAEYVRRAVFRELVRVESPLPMI